MKKRAAVLFLAVILLLGTIHWLGVGPYISGSAVVDLHEQLEALHGAPYAEKITENGTESMEFSIKPATVFLTSYKLRHILGWDYRYSCEVVYTVSQGENTVGQRKISYVGIDPMGPGEEYARAYLIQE